MDEILRPQGPHGGAADGQALPIPEPEGFLGKLRHSLALTGDSIARRWYRLDDVLSGHKHLAPVPFLLFTGVLAASLIVGTLYTSAYTVTVDGSEWGIVSDVDAFEEVIETVEDKVSAILGEDYTIDNEITYSSILTKRNTLTSTSLLEARLYSQVTAVTQSYVLTVDGQVIGIGDKPDLEKLLDQVSATYVTENTKEVSFEQEIEITYQAISSNTEQDLTAMLELLTSNTIGETTYTAQEGDTYSTIAANNDMTLDEFYALNPDVDSDSEMLQIGDVLTVSRAVPYLSVRTVDTETYTESISYSTEQVEDSSMYKGETKVVTVGVDGVAQVTANVTYVNGYEESREVTSTVTVTEPVTQVIAVGTKEKPSTFASGSFSWPVSGTVSSRFGYRSGSMHRGIDICASYGTTITAADGGTVTYAGYYSTYGYLVIIDHGNGYQTYYAHCSSISVSVGTKVYKGQAIAKVGATGNATGNHCHFEIRLNGTAVNPLNYLS
ncbi:MAG: peptidoglycan DD-metalloendopeptidase family protein [Oscillospiraceae bacterium]|nr:peptidoglycan DD-metalloendopeptidase family protein [Oscillospiraceae bacterium]